MFDYLFKFMLLGLSFAMALEINQPISAQEIIPLWKGTAPGSEKFTGKEHVEERGTPEQSTEWITGVSEPTLTLFDATTKDHSKTAMIICPGGGYGGLSQTKEGTEIAQWLAKQGVTCFVLKYRHGGGPHQHPVPLTDVQRAVRTVRSLAKDKGYSPDRIGVMGFSAGGHLASSVGTHFDEGNKDAADMIEQQSCRPDFLVLIYPVISMEADVTHGGSLANLLGEKPDDELVQLMSNDTQVTEQTPPTFIVHASDDAAVPVENALRFYRALVGHKVPAELHMFAEGGHGFGMRQPGPVKEWPIMLLRWLDSRGLVTPAGK